MKKILAIIMALVLVFSLAACGGDKDEHTPTTPKPPVTSPDETEPTVKPTEPETIPTITTPPHVHEYLKAETINATCNESGYSTYRCECGDSYDADYVEATGHSWGEWITTRTPTTTREGKAERSCSSCTKKEYKDLPREVEDHTHEYTSTLTKEPTCTTVGEKTCTCSCGDSYKEEVAKIDHKYQSIKTNATCVDKGYTTYQCKTCNHHYDDDYVDALGHDYDNKVTKPTCTEGGYTTHTCTRCKNSFKDSPTSATGHNWSEWQTVKEPTTTTTGLAKRSCSWCNKEETKVLDKKPDNHKHSYSSEVTKAATCTTDGVKTYMCSCGDSYTERIAKLGHNYQSKVTNPTCTEKGYTTYTCKNCNDAYISDYVAAVGHKYSSKVTTTPTCTRTGVKTYTCSVCSHSYNETLDKLDHSYNSAVTKPTCTEDGYTTHTCTGCGKSYKDTVVKATGHSYGTPVTTTEPTCEKDGVKTSTCNNCSHKKNESITKLGHNYKDTVTKPTCTTKGYTTHTCTRCNNSYKDAYTEETGHSYGKGVVTKPTCEAEGYTTYTCTHCSYSYKTDKVKATGHWYEVVSDTATCTSAGIKTEKCTSCGKTRTSESPKTGHRNTVEERVEPTCSKDGRVITKCADCGAPISVKVLDATGECDYSKKMPLDEAVADELKKGHTYYAKFGGFEDYDVYVCSGCGDIDIDTMKFRYTEYEAASIMLGYVNELRASVGVAPLQLDTTLIEKANIAAKQYYEAGKKPTTGLTGNFVDGGNSIRHHFEKFKAGNSYHNMVNSGFKYFGYALYKDPNGGANSLYAVQLFWDGKSPF
jgi:predicted small lipoprotein YifL